MGRLYRDWIDDDTKVYACGKCRTHLSSGRSLVSRQFHCKTGRAYLFATACNVTPGPQEERMMTTGMHVVQDVYCINCMTCVGWQYVCAYEKSQKYKEGKFILERALVVDWEKTSPSNFYSTSSGSETSSQPGARGPIVHLGCDESSDDDGY